MPKAVGVPGQLTTPTAPVAQAPPATLEELFGDLQDQREVVKVILYGREGQAKTTSAARAENLPGDGIVVFINAESGLKPTALRTFLNPDKLKVFPSKAGVKITYNSLETLLYQLQAMLQRDPDCIKCIVMDSVTEIGNILMEEITEEAFDAAALNSKLAKRANRHVTMVQDFGEMTTKARTLLRGFRDLPCHFVATALEKELDLGGEVKEMAPELTPKLATSVLGYMDVVIRMRSESIEVTVTQDVDGEAVESVELQTLVTGQCLPTETVRAKDRFNVFPLFLEDPSMDRIVQYVQGDIVRSADPLSSEYEYARQNSEQTKAAKKAARQAKIQNARKA